MDIQREREAFERLPLAELAIKSEYVYYNEETNSYWPNEDFCPSDAPETMNFAWKAWQAAKAQAVPEWIDYTKQSPRIDGRYQIFISGEQITADWQSPFGFSDPVEGEALIQGLISHWGMLPEPPKPQEPTND
ncbi:hypothetical protein [Acinetobacter sp. YH12144]|uniref:hypothetical protein n=1 Tax=Acinetobacter sp. YH12144 TaxID=2601128 RepID=UPI0015D276C1|nr:hypothetical protein [Acinetobacter sp. YH12144]